MKLTVSCLGVGMGSSGAFDLVFHPHPEAFYHQVCDKDEPKTRGPKMRGFNPFGAQVGDCDDSAGFNRCIVLCIQIWDLRENETSSLFGCRLRADCLLYLCR